MGVMPAKHIDLKAYNAGLNSNGLLSALPFLGTLDDPILMNHVQEDKRIIITDIDLLSAGDEAYSGNQKGIVTNILDDGAGVKNRIEVTFETPYIQTQGVDPINRVVVFNVVDNSQADPQTGEKLEVEESLRGIGVTFMKRV